MTIARSVSTVTKGVASAVTRGQGSVTPFEYSEDQVFFHSLASYTTPSVGSATNAFSRNFGVSQLQSNGTYTESSHQTAAFQHNVTANRTVYKSTYGISGLLAFGTNRDLTGANWAITNGTRAKTQTGIDGTSNACTLFSATSADATLLNARTGSSSARTFSAFIKRTTGTGNISLTLDNGSTWTVVTVPNDGAFHRVSATQTVTNPTYGFKLTTSGDAIAIDACSDVALGYAIDTFIGRTDQQSSTWSMSSVSPTIEPNRRYKATIKTRINYNESSNNSNIFLGASGGSNSVRVAYIGSNQWNMASIKAGATQINRSETAGTTVSVGDNVTVEMYWGRGKMQYRLNGVHEYTDDTSTAADPNSISDIVLSGNADYWDLEIKELYGRTLCLVGDSIMFGWQHRFHELDQDRFDTFGRGLGGNKITDVTGRVATDITTTFNSRTTSNICILWIGSNTLADNVSGATALTQLATCISTIKSGASGWKVWCIKVLPRGGGFTGTDAAGFATQAAIYNAGLSAAGADKVIDFNTVPESQDYDNTTYYDSFKIHPTTALYDLFWPIIEAEIDY